MKQFSRSLSTKEIEKNLSHIEKNELHSILNSLNSQGIIIQQCGFGLEAWKYNSDSISVPTNTVTNKSPINTFSMVGSPVNQGQLSFQATLQQNFSKAKKRGNYQTSPQQALVGSKKARQGDFQKHISPQQSVRKAFVTKTQPKTNFMVSNDVFNALNKNPVSALFELCQKNGVSVSLKLVSENIHNQKNKFTVAALVNGQFYDSATASNMKDAKREAADMALKV